MRQMLVFIMFVFVAPAAAVLYLLGLVVLHLIRLAHRTPEWQPTAAQQAAFDADMAVHRERLRRQGPTIPMPTPTAADDYYAKALGY